MPTNTGPAIAAYNLTGRHIDTSDSIEDLQRRTAEIVQNDFYVLRRRE